VQGPVVGKAKFCGGKAMAPSCRWGEQVLGEIWKFWGESNKGLRRESPAVWCDLEGRGREKAGFPATSKKMLRGSLGETFHLEQNRRWESLRR